MESNARQETPVEPGEAPAVQDPAEERLAFVLAGQNHAEHFLRPIADPAGKSVLVVGCGAGTEVVWCLRHGAREVVGIDVLEQGREALDEAARRLGLDAGRATLLRLPVERVAELGRRFDLVLANNVFEHVGDLAGAFAACAAAVEPGSGRVAVFSSPLWFSSAGSHLPHAPWEHLWAPPDDLRRRLLDSGRLAPGHPLERLDLAAYLDREITLNRARVADWLAAIAACGLAVLHLQVLADERLAELPAARARWREAGIAAPAPFDLSAAGIAVELALPPSGADPAFAPPSTADRRRAAEHEAIAGSLSFRLGRALTAPARRLRDLLRR